MNSTAVYTFRGTTIYKYGIEIMRCTEDAGVEVADLLNRHLARRAKSTARARA